MGRRKAFTEPPNWEKMEDVPPFKLAEKRYKRYHGRSTDFSSVLDPLLTVRQHRDLRLAKAAGGAADFGESPELARASGTESTGNVEGWRDFTHSALERNSQESDSQEKATFWEGDDGETLSGRGVHDKSTETGVGGMNAYTRSAGGGYSNVFAADRTEDEEEHRKPQSAGDAQVSAANVMKNSNNIGTEGPGREEDACLEGVSRLKLLEGSSRAFMIEGRDGLVVLPGFLSRDEELSWARRCLVEYPEPPNQTNLNAHHGEITQLWTEHGELLEALRWCTLGYQYDWTNRSYTEKARNPIPEAVSELYDKALREVKLERSHIAEAAIVNFYTPKSTLGGHLDDVEPDQEAPIVSVSLGCTAVFLIGGSTHHDEPDAILVRGGDAIVMSGASRRSLHGVPRILSLEETAQYEAGAKTQLARGEVEAAPGSQLEDTVDADDAFVQYLTRNRINLNIRQVNAQEKAA